MATKSSLQFLERMQQTYGELAEETGAYKVGACGWDSIPCKIWRRTNFSHQIENIFRRSWHRILRKNFDATPCNGETFVQLKNGDADYRFNDATYQTLILALTHTTTNGLGRIRHAIMPEKLERSKYKPPLR